MLSASHTICVAGCSRSLRRAYLVVAIICGTLLYYFLDGIRQNASALAEVVDKKGQSTTKLNVTMGQLLENKEMLIVMAILLSLHWWCIRSDD